MGTKTKDSPDKWLNFLKANGRLVRYIIDHPGALPDEITKDALLVTGGVTDLMDKIMILEKGDS